MLLLCVENLLEREMGRICETRHAREKSGLCGAPEMQEMQEIRETGEIETDKCIPTSVDLT